MAAVSVVVASLWFHNVIPMFHFGHLRKVMLMESPLMIFFFPTVLFLLSGSFSDLPAVQTGVHWWLFEYHPSEVQGSEGKSEDPAVSRLMCMPLKLKVMATEIFRRHWWSGLWSSCVHRCRLRPNLRGILYCWPLPSMSVFDLIHLSVPTFSSLLVCAIFDLQFAELWATLKTSKECKSALQFQVAFQMRILLQTWHGLPG